ncbi:MAG: multidrug resistance efflux pump [Candidatus Paceibacteria bacterium]|jgi:multidrug resistance efflux pump
MSQYRSQPSLQQTLALASLFALLTTLPSCSEEVVQALKRARPVTALTLRAQSPGIMEALPGVAEPYRESQLAFEVGGRVEFVLDLGTEVEGALLDEAGQLILNEDGSPVREGTVVAQIDGLRYQQALDELELRKRAAELGLEAQKTTLRTVLVHDLESVKAQARAAALEVEALLSDVDAMESARVLAFATMTRNRELIRTNAISQLALEQSEAEAKTGNARVAQAKTAVEAQRGVSEAAASAVAKAQGAILVKESELAVARADIATLDQQLEQARTDLESCALYAPFSGRLTEVSVAQGAFVQTGSPVATLTFLNPMLIAVTVSEEDNRRILLGSSVAIYPSIARRDLEGSEALNGYVWEKGEVADPATRTFRVGLLARNQPRLAYDQPAGQDQPPTVDSLFPVIYREPHLPGPLYVNRESIGDDNGQSYVLRARGIREGERAEGNSLLMHADRINVELGTQTARFLSWSFVALKDPGVLARGDMLVWGPRPGLADGFVISNKEWIYRPGDLVRVVFDLGNLPEGYYVPVQAISELNGRTSVFVIDSEDQVSRLDVQVHESWNESRRVTSPGLSEGLRVVLRGVHFLADGESVDVLSTLEQ